MWTWYHCNNQVSGTLISHPTPKKVAAVAKREQDVLPAGISISNELVVESRYPVGNIIGSLTRIIIFADLKTQAILKQIHVYIGSYKLCNLKLGGRRTSRCRSPRRPWCNLLALCNHLPHIPLRRSWVQCGNQLLRVRSQQVQSLTWDLGSSYLKPNSKLLKYTTETK